MWCFDAFDYSGTLYVPTTVAQWVARITMTLRPMYFFWLLASLKYNIQMCRTISRLWLRMSDGSPFFVFQLLCCSNETDKERWIEALSPPKSEDPDETLYECWDCPQVTAIHPYATSQPDELQLSRGDVINVTRKMADGIICLNLCSEMFNEFSLFRLVSWWKD